MADRRSLAEARRGGEWPNNTAEAEVSGRSIHLPETSGIIREKGDNSNLERKDTFP